MLDVRCPYSQSYGLSSSHVQMWELDWKEGWVLKNPCFWTVMLEKTFDSPWDCEEIKPVNPKGNQPWILIGRTDAEAEAPILQPPGVKNWPSGKDPDAGKDRRQDEREQDGWMASPTLYTWAWASSGRRWRTGKPGVLQFLGLQRVRHHRVTGQQQGDKLGWLKEWANLIQITIISTTAGKNPLEGME